jgi:hypothetical protein
MEVSHRFQETEWCYHRRLLSLTVDKRFYRNGKKTGNRLLKH